MADQKEYTGVEVGPIRPPSEAGSLYLRVTRNCPWNKCRFCALYKGLRFSRRPVEHVLRDIDSVADEAERLLAGGGGVARSAFATGAGCRDCARDPVAMEMTRRWMAAGGRTVFLQDANALSMSHGDLLEVLHRIKERLPWVERITSYARSRSIVGLGPEQLAELRTAGLTRMHIGFESGSDRVLAFMEKGATKAMHLEAGLHVKQAGIELSAYYMPGLGGTELLEESALESADLMRQVVPDYLRLRSLAVPDGAPLATDVATGTFRKAGHVEMMQEIRMFLEHVGDIPSMLVSDHQLNLLSGLSGNLATRRGSLLSMVQRFLSLDPGSQNAFMIGRRLGVLTRLEELDVPRNRALAEAYCSRLGVTSNNVDAVLDGLVKRFV